MTTQHIDFKSMSVSGVQLGHVLGLSHGRISQLEQKGLFTRDKDKRFPLCESVISYTTFTRKGAKKNSPDASYEKARARKMEASADIEEMNAAKRRGELVEIDQVVDIVEKEYGIVRTKIFSIPNKIALDIFSCESPQQVQETLIDQINEALSELAYDIGSKIDGDQGEDIETFPEDQSS